MCREMARRKIVIHQLKPLAVLQFSARGSRISKSTDDRRTHLTRSSSTIGQALVPRLGTFALTRGKSTQDEQNQTLIANSSKGGDTQ